MSEVVHFYQTGTFTVGNRLVTPEERAGQASMERARTFLTTGTLPRRHPFGPA